MGPMTAYNYHSATLVPLSNSQQHHHQSQQFIASHMLYPGFVEPPPPYGAATAPILLDPSSHCSLSGAASSVGPTGAASSSSGAQHSPVLAAITGAGSGSGDQWPQRHTPTDKIISQQQQQLQLQTNLLTPAATTTTSSSNSSNNNSNNNNGMIINDGVGHLQQQQPPGTTCEASVLPPGAVPYSPPPPPPPPIHGVYSSQHIPMSHSYPIGGPSVPNQHAQIVKMIITVPLGPHEVQLECSNCRQSVRTRVVRRPGLLTWIICGALALVGCWPCCVLPFCAQSCQDAEHFCSNCNAFIGKYSRI